MRYCRMGSNDARYYRADLALVHHREFGFYADRCADGILTVLEPLRVRDGMVLELGCGSGRLTRHLVDAGQRVIATDASPAMLELAREVVPDAEEIRQLVLRDDPLPAVDALVSVGHVLNYLADKAAIERALVAMADALRPGGILAIDLCDLRWAEVRRDEPNLGKVGEDWAIITEFSVPSPTRYVREMTTFIRNEDGSWHRDRERHDNILIDTSRVPPLLAEHGLEASTHSSFDSHPLPEGLVAIIGGRPA